MIRVLLLLAALLVASPAHANLTFSLRTGEDATKRQSMPIDSNQCSSAGPRAMYVGGVVTNTAATTVTNISASLTGIGNGFFLAGGQAATQPIGSLAAGASTGVYWFVGYGCVDGAATAPTIGFTSSAPASNTVVTLTARSAISANAGGNVLSSQLGPGAVVGQTIYFDAEYDFGGSEVNDEFFLQPSGGQNFNAACFRLVGTEIRSSNITPITVGTRNRIYFRQTVKQSGNGFRAGVRYFFEYQCAGTSTTARPYAVQTSGNTNIKYTGNFDGSGSISIAFPGATNPFTIAKTADVSSAVAGAATTVKYTVTISNPSTNASRVSQIVDLLPAGAIFLALDPASNVTAANSSSVPAANATGTLTFTGRQDTSYLIAAGGTVRLIYTARIPGTIGTYVNSAQGRFGTASTSTASHSFQVIVPPPLTVSKTSTPYLDPINGLANPKLIPNAFAAYTVTVSNPNSYSVTSDSIVIVDPTPDNLRFFAGNLATGSGPVLFANGPVASGLSYTFTSLASTSDDIDFSKDGGATWTYVPVPDSSGLDAALTHIRVRPKGAMAAGSSFTLRFRYAIK